MENAYSMEKSHLSEIFSEKKRILYHGLYNPKSSAFSYTSDLVIIDILFFELHHCIEGIILP